MLNTWGFLCKGREAEPSLPRRLGVKVVNDLVASVLTVWLGRIWLLRNLRFISRILPFLEFYFSDGRAHLYERCHMDFTKGSTGG